LRLEKINEKTSRGEHELKVEEDRDDRQEDKWKKAIAKNGGSPDSINPVP